jgi:hypothetical protein
MATPQLLDITRYRKRKSHGRIMELMERFFTDVTMPKAEEPVLQDADELEEFMAQVLADHLIGKLNSSNDATGLKAQFRQFNQRLKRGLQIKMRTRARFEALQSSF